MSESTLEASFKEYVYRINKVIDYIRLNIEKDICLAELADVSNFSKFHFHRIFRAMTGVTPNDFIVKMKLGRAEYILNNNSEATISNIAYLSGFSSSSTFSKSFKKEYFVSPSKWREQRQNSKIEHVFKKKASDIAPIFNTSKTINMELTTKEKIEIKELDDLPVIYVRNLSIHVHDSEGFSKMFDTLMKWATPKGLLNFPATKALTVYRSMPDDNGLLQADACLSVPKEINGEGVLGKTIIKGGKYAVLHKEGTLDECFKAWDYLYKEWFPKSGYQPDDRGVFLSHLNDAKAHPNGMHIFDMCISIKSL